MKLKNLTIGARLTLGFGVLLFLVVILGVVSFNQSGRLWNNTDNLYNHPHMVGKTVRDVEINILNIHLRMRDLALDGTITAGQINSLIEEIDSIENVIYQQFAIINERYLGSISTLDSAKNKFINWKQFRDELIEIRITKGSSDASKRFLSVNKAYVENMIKEVNTVVDFSNNKAIELFTAAGNEKNQLTRKLIILFLIIVTFSFLVLILLIKIIRSPLKALSGVADIYRLGDYSIRSDYESTNEIGTLALAFNKMAASVQNSINIKDHTASVAKLIMNENELRPFCKVLLKELMKRTESQTAAIYLLNNTGEKFEHFESIGLSSEKIKDFSVGASEGEFGAVLADKSIIRISGIPDDTLFQYSTVTGNFKPKEIVSIPILDDNKVIAIISLATIKVYSELSVRFIYDIQAILTARLIGVISYQKIKDFSAVLDLQNRELDQKSKELVMQSDELKEYNIELQQQKQKLDEANKLKSAFLSNMSHELRTPLNSVIALSGVLTRRLEGKIPPDEYQYIGIIERNGKNLLSLINDILDLSRIEAGKEEIFLTQFSMGEILQNIFTSIEPLAIEKRISVSCFIEPDLPQIVSDQAKVNHIIQNIISNAVKFTEIGTVEILAILKSENIHVVVKDTGIGISEDFIPHIFDEFRQADDKASRKFGGTGLGLAIVKKYCQMLNCSIDVSSKLGDGSVFTLIFPLKLSGFRNSSVKTDPELNYAYNNSSKNVTHFEKSGVGKTLLVVEDSEPQIIQLTDILEAEGFIVVVARNGREALESISHAMPDGMILDLQMPEVDGFEVLRKIRGLKETQSLPILILTAKHITSADLSFLRENHIYQLIQKGSLNRNELLNHVRSLIIPIEVRDSKASVKGKNSKKSILKPNILVIEDNNDSLITLRALLEENYIITSVSDGYDGLAKAVLINPDLILLDISLPGMDGFKVLDEIRKNTNLAGTQVIALTARAMKGDRENLLAYGFDGYIAKPLDNETFLNTIDEYLGNRQ
jgi:signal transduction histidine kinase/CheY-like chemotaxis protein/CHASE3 domain sensor protein